MLDKCDFCMFLRNSELYKHKGKEAEAIICFLQYPVEKYSVEDVCGYHQLQMQIYDELPYLSGMPSYVKPMSLLESVNRIDEIYKNCLQMQFFCAHVKAYGVERYAAKHMEDLERNGQYYVQLDARDALISNEICKKPASLNDMDLIAKSDSRYYVNQSVWRDVYGDELYDVYYLRERVGFDRTKLNVDIIEIDIDRLLEAKKRLCHDSYAELPRIRMDYVDSDDVRDIPLVLPLRDNNIKSIEVTLSHHVKFVFKRNNSPLMDNGRRKRDIYILEITVEPDSGYEILGNIRNYDYEEMKSAVEQAIDDLYVLTGIKINKRTVRLNDVELNLTFRQNCDFNNLMRSVCYYQDYTRKGYVTKEFKTSDAGIVRCMDYVMNGCRTEAEYNRKKRSIEKQYVKMRTTGYVTSNQSVFIKLYDKKNETIAYAKSHGYDLKIEDDAAIVRLEFRIRNSGQLQNYFGTEKDPVYFFQLSQEKIEMTYVNLVDIFFKSTYENQYVPESMETLYNIVSALDTSSKGGKWKQDLLREILGQEIWKKSTPALLSEKDISSVMKYNKTFSRHPEKYKKVLFELLQESDVYEKGQKNAYDMLFNFLIKTYYLRTLSQHRRIGYACAGPGEKLPEKEHEIELAMHLRKTWNELKNFYADN